MDADEEMPHDARLPNKDFRKSDLNRAEFYDQESDVFDREPSPEVRRSRGHRISDSYGKDSQAAQVSFLLTMLYAGLGGYNYIPSISHNASCSSSSL